MKKLFAILLLSVYLFNLTGYSLLFQHFIAQTDSELIKQLDNNSYNDYDLVEVKVPLHMPYISNSAGYERVDGELEHNGVHYNYVKRKVSNDTLYVMCLPNVCKTQLYKAKTEYSREVNELPSNKKSTETSKKAGFDTEHNRTSNLSADFNITMALAIQYPPTHAALLHTAYIALPEQPPKTIC